MIPCLWRTSRRFCCPHLNKRSTSPLSPFSAISAEKFRANSTISPSFNLRPGLANAHQLLPETSLWSVTSILVFTFFPISRDGITFVSLKTRTSPGSRMLGRSVIAASFGVASTCRSRAESRGLAGFCAIKFLGMSKSKSETFIIGKTYIIGCLRANMVRTILATL